MKTLALIPARGGSERLPGKNLATIGKRTLLHMAVDIGLQTCATTVVSTDHPGIAAEAARCGAHVIDRPAFLAKADTPMIDVCRHAVSLFTDADVLVLLQPTSPLRQVADVCAVLDHIVRTGGDSVVTVVKTDQRPEVYELGWLGRMRPPQRDPAARTLFAENGAVYAIRVAHILNGGTFESGFSYAVEMPKDRSIDIDTAQDLEMARLAYDRLWHREGEDDGPEAA